LHMEGYNPWWYGERDVFFDEWLRLKVRWVPKVLDKFSFIPFSLHFFIGPRQVGKTTALRILINRLLKCRDPRSIFYFSCDEVVDFRELGEVLDNYLSYREAWGVGSSIIILDEVTFVSEWYRALKSRIDRGVFKNDVLIITGSASIELIAGKERFPGRRGYGRDIYMYPMSFSEYVGHFGGISLIVSGIEEIDSLIDANRVFSNRLRELFMNYLKTGGFPLPIRELFERGFVSYLSRRAYLDWLRSDWLKSGKSENYMKEIISYILEASPSPVSWNVIARNTSVSSPNTVRDYIELLSNLMVARISYWISPSGEVNYRKNKKISFVDPFLYDVFSKYTKVDVDESIIVEAIVASHFSRLAPVFYWRNRSEVDVIIKYRNKLLGFEVKWRRKPIYARRPFRVRTLDREMIPLLLASLSYEL